MISVVFPNIEFPEVSEHNLSPQTFLELVSVREFPLDLRASAFGIKSDCKVGRIPIDKIRGMKAKVNSFT